jgi:histidinol-phosphatase (PHP family)
MIHSNLHTHTTFSDGKNSPEEMIERALELGFCSLGFSDHSETAFDPWYCMAKEDYLPYREKILEVKKQYEDRIPVFLGMEKDLYSQIDPEDYEYIIGSVHYVSAFGEYHSIDGSPENQLAFFEKAGEGGRLELAKRYYDAVVTHAQLFPFQIQGHFDLITKFGFYDDENEEYRRVALEALDEVLAIVPFIEINSGAIARGRRTVPYPSRFLLERICKKGGRVILSSDCHFKEYLDENFDSEVELLKEIGFSSLWQKQKNGFTEIKI